MKTRWKALAALVAAGALLAGSTTAAHAAGSATLPFTWTVGASHSQNQYTTDGDFNIVHDGADLWLITSNANTVWRWKGTTMDNLVAQPNSVLHNFPSGNNSINWISGVTVGTNGTWYGIVHTELSWVDNTHGVRTHFRRISLAASTDHGANFTWIGNIITSDNNDSDVFAYTNDYYDNGPGDQKLFVDTASGYYYLYYQHNWIDGRTGQRYQAMRVARSPISANLAAGSWTKYYNGSWSQPGLGGRDSDIFTNADSSVVVWSTYLNKYVVFARNTDEVNGGSADIAVATSLAAQDWTPLQKLTGVTLDWYNMAIDPTTWSKYQVGQNIRLYSADSIGGGTHYVDFSFGTGSTTSATFDKVYPDEPVPDGNPGWGTGAMTTAITAGTTYKIANRYSNKALDVTGASTADGAQVIQYNYQSQANQKWTLVDAGGGWFKIRSVNSGLLLDVSGAVTTDGANVVQYHDVGGLNQQWKIVPAESGYFTLQNRLSGKLLDVADGSTSDNGRIDQWTANGGYNQEFDLVPTS